MPNVTPDNNAVTNTSYGTEADSISGWEVRRDTYESIVMASAYGSAYQGSYKVRISGLQYDDACSVDLSGGGIPYGETAYMIFALRTVSGGDASIRVLQQNTWFEGGINVGNFMAYSGSWEIYSVSFTTNQNVTRMVFANLTPDTNITLEIDALAVTYGATAGDTCSAYQLQIALDSGFTNLVYDSGKITLPSPAPNGTVLSHQYRGSDPELFPNTRYYWRVRVWDSLNVASSWGT